MIVLAAAELFGSKLNRELEFPSIPTLTELKNLAVAVFNDEIAARKRRGQSGPSAFNLHYMQLFDALGGRWVELKSSTQLRDRCQVYLFQKDSWNKETQAPIPSPTRPSSMARAVSRASSTGRRPASTPMSAMRRSPPSLNRVSGRSSPSLKRDVKVESPRRMGEHAAVSRVASAGSLGAASGGYGLSLNRAASYAMTPPRTNDRPPISSITPIGALGVTPLVRDVQLHSLLNQSARAKSLSPPVSPTHSVASLSMMTFGDKLSMLYTAMLNHSSVGDKSPRAGNMRSPRQYSKDKLVASVDDDAFRALFMKTRIGLEPLQITNLFQQADANSDDSISFGEWERFGEQYPTMIDAMHIRIRDHNKDLEQKQEIEAVRQAVQERDEMCRKQNVAVSDAERSTAAAEENLKKQRETLQEARVRERDAKAITDAARQETERARGTVAQRAADVAHAQDSQLQEEANLVEAQRNVDATKRLLQELAGETAAAERRLEDLRKMVLEQEQVVAASREREEHGHQELDTRQRDLEDASQHVNHSKNETQLALDRLSVSEQALATAQAREEECGVSQLQARDEVNRQCLREEQEEQETRMAREQENAQRQRLADALAALEMQQAETRRLIDANATHNIKRDQEEEKEKPMIEQEIRLRQARLQLEEEEAKLRIEHRSFANTTGRS
ncbi:calmodulin-like protein containing EF hand domain [Diplonema papillatum]|nr:calmodulin-like protein containing EF hand domain [Diplonema papillatum]